MWTKIVDDHGFIIIGFIAIISSSSISIFYVYYTIIYIFCVNVKSPINCCKLLP